MTIVRDDSGRISGLPQIERLLDACLDSLRSARSADRELARLDWNRVQLYVWPAVDAPLSELDQVIRSLAARTGALGLEQVLVQFRSVEGGAESRELMLRMSRPPGAGLTLRITDPPPQPLRELNAYTQNVIRARRRGTVYPYELIPLIIRSPDPGGAPGTFTEYDLDEAGVPVPVDRAYGSNTANLVLGVVSTPTRRYPEGMRRVVLLGDPTRALGALAEPECRRVLAAIELARRLHAPVEWFAISAGAKIAMDSGTETMDWISRVLRGIIEFTQDGGEINVVVTGINVGAQPYWNAEATMLMHTRGVLIMTPRLGHGADREAVARLLRRDLGRGQLRHRRLRPDHGPERRGPVLGARLVRRGRRAARALRAHVHFCGRAFSAAGPRPPIPPTGTSPRRRTPARTSARSARSSMRRTVSARGRSTCAR